MPDFFPLHIESLHAFLLVFTRVTSLMAFMPIIGGQALPNQMKAGLAALMSAVIFPLIDTEQISVDIDILELGVLIVEEALIGIVTAFLLNLIFAAVQLGGMMIDFQIGFAITNVLDPLTNSRVSVTGRLLNMSTMLIFLSINAHHWILLGIVDSFHTIPLGGFDPDPAFGELIIDAWSAVYVTGMQIAAPLTITLLLKQVAMGLIARTVPQMNILIVGFPVTIALGMFTVAISLPVLSQYLLKLFGQLPYQIQIMYNVLG